MIRIALTLALLAPAFIMPAVAHDGVKHKNAGEARAHLQSKIKPNPEDDGAVTPFPIKLGGAYSLTDQTGATRTEADPEGRLQLVFFGYAKCQAICEVALPRMEEMAGIAQTAGIGVQPVLITVDPERDTPEEMAKELAERHPGFVGLTGSEEELAAARKLFQIERKHVFDDPEFGAIYAHGSHIYLMDAQGGFLTFIPPILSPDRGAEIIAKYAASQS